MCVKERGEGKREKEGGREKEGERREGKEEEEKQQLLLLSSTLATFPQGLSILFLNFNCVLNCCVCAAQAREYVGMLACVYPCGGWSRLPGISFCHSLPYFLRQALLLNWKLLILAKLASQWALSMPLSLPMLGLQACVSVPSTSPCLSLYLALTLQLCAIISRFFLNIDSGRLQVLVVANQTCCSLSIHRSPVSN